MKKRLLISTFVLAFFIGWALLSQVFFTSSKSKKNVVSIIQINTSENQNDVNVDETLEEPKVVRIIKEDQKKINVDDDTDDLLDDLEYEFTLNRIKEGKLVVTDDHDDVQDLATKFKGQKFKRNPSSNVKKWNRELSLKESDLWVKSALK